MTSVQVERRVVNQLAAAYEEGVIARGSSLRLVVEGEGGGVRVGMVVMEGAHSKRVSIGTIDCYHGNHMV